MRNILLFALLYVIHVQEADLFLHGQIGNNNGNRDYCSKESSKWDDCKRCKCQHDISKCIHCIGCGTIECGGQFNSHDCSKGSSLWTFCHGCYCKHEYHTECMYCMHCHPGQVECEVQTHAPLPAVTDAPITTSKPHSSRCDIVGIFGAVARNQFIQNLQAITCQPDKGQHDNDALVMTLCSAPESSKWIEGEQVLLRNGTCSESAKPYTPIFYHRENVRRAGILISCDGSEIRYFYQDCDTTPVVRHENSTAIEKIHVLTWT